MCPAGGATHAQTEPSCVTHAQLPYFVATIVTCSPPNIVCLSISTDNDGTKTALASMGAETTSCVSVNTKQ